MILKQNSQNLKVYQELIYLTLESSICFTGSQIQFSNLKKEDIILGDMKKHKVANSKYYDY